MVCPTSRSWGGLSVVGPTMAPVPGFGLDVWDRLGAIQHRAYLLNFHGGLPTSDDPTKKRGLWEDLSAFARESNIRTFVAFARVVGSLSCRRQLGTELGTSGRQVPTPLEDPAPFPTEMGSSLLEPAERLDSLMVEVASLTQLQSRLDICTS